MHQVTDVKSDHMSTQSPPVESTVPYTHVHRWLRQSLEHAQDGIVVGLALVLFGFMIRSLISLGHQTLAAQVDFRTFLGETLFMMILIELLRLLVIYLGEHHVAVDVMVETSIVASLREVILKGVVELSSASVLAITVFVLALGLLLRFGDLRRRRPRRARGGRFLIP
jgi:uncharacterized membrane protein (DUF373 family)